MVLGGRMGERDENRENNFRDWERKKVGRNQSVGCASWCTDLYKCCKTEN